MTNHTDTVSKHETRAKHHRATGRHARGFTLIEVMVVVAVAGILFATAVHALSGSSEEVLEIRRAQAKSALLEAAMRQESYFMIHKRYAETVGAGGLELASTTDGGHYLIQMAPGDEDCDPSGCYTLRAIPRESRPEDACGTLLLTSHGARLPQRCW